jgi:hypothetical protein
MWFCSKKNRKLSLDGGIFSRLPYAHALSYRMRFALSHSLGDLDNSFILIRVFCFPFWRVISYLSLTAGNNEIFRNGSPSTPVMDDDTLFELGNLQVRPKSRGGYEFELHFHLPRETWTLASCHPTLTRRICRLLDLRNPSPIINALR